MGNLLINRSFNLFGLEIAYYGVLIALGMLVAILIACYTVRYRGLKSDDIIILALIVLPLSIIGARLYYVAFTYKDYHYTFLEILRTRDGGMAIYGGLIGGFIGILIYKFIFKKNLLAICDVVVPSLIIAQGIGRWGNFINQEAYGNLITNPAFQWFPFGVYIDASHSITGQADWFMATFFYESFLNFIGFFILYFTLRNNRINGIPTATYFVYYGAVRFLVEGLRTDSLYTWFLGLRVSQIVSLALVILGVVWISIVYIKKYQDKKKMKVLEKS